MADFDSIFSGNNGGPARTTQHDLRNLAREHAPEALALAIRVLSGPRATPHARIAAARTLLERGWGEGLREQARPHRHEALATLLGIMNDVKVSLRTRIAAADALLDYAGGEAKARTVSPILPERQRWLDELKEIQEQFAAGRPTFDRPPARN